MDDPRNPISGDFASLSTQQFVSVGDDSPTFNRTRISYTHFIPVNFLKINKGCRPKPGEKADCRQTIGMQVKTGTVMGQLPPYEAFCTGGGQSVRGWSACELGVGRTFGEASVEYRFPIWSIIAGELFVDGATDFDSQAKVPVIPVAHNAGLLWPKNSFLKYPNRLKSKSITLKILPEIQPGLSKPEFLSKLETAIETSSDELINLEK